MKRHLIALVVVLIAGLASATAQAQIPVTDGANLTQQMRQFLQMVKEYEMLKQQYDQLKRQYEAITGRYGFGDQFNNAVSRRWVPGSWQEVVAMQKSGKFGSKQDFYEKLLKTVDPLIYKALGKDNDGRMYHAYKLSTDATRGAFAAVEALYDSIGERLKSIEGLQGQIISVDGNALASAEHPWSKWCPVKPNHPVYLATGARNDILIDLDPEKSGIIANGDYLVTFEFLDWEKRAIRNAQATSPLNVGRAVTRIRVT